jgi:hypothetical protein
MVVHLACGADGSDDASDEFIVVDHPHEVSPSAAGAAPALPRSGGDHTVGVTTWKTSVDLWVNGVSTLELLIHSSLDRWLAPCQHPRVWACLWAGVNAQCASLANVISL